MIWLIGGLLVIVLITIGLGLYVSRRFYVAEVHTPLDVGLAYETVDFFAEDGIHLTGWWIPAAGSDRAVLQLHGHSGSMDCDIGFVPNLHAAGFNVLMIDFRGHGRSGGKRVTFGAKERLDVQAAAQWLKHKGMRKVGAVGISLGGMSAICGAATCQEIDALIDDGAPARLWSAIIGWGYERHLPDWLCALPAWQAVVGASLLAGVNIFSYEPLRWIDRIAPRPLMIIHGDRDPYCPEIEEMIRRAAPQVVWRLPDAGHTQAHQLYPGEYNRRVVEFLNQAIP